MDVIIINNINDFFEALHNRIKKHIYTHPWWRGQADQNWDLVTSLYRNNFQENEISLTQGFRNNARPRYENPPNRDDYCSWLFLMQHYGLPTRLLDWTYSPLIAIFFTVQSMEYEKCDGALWALKPNMLNQMQNGQGRLLHSGSSEIQKLFYEAFFRNKIDPDKRHLAVSADQFDLRHYVQQSNFTIHGSDMPLNKVDGADNFLEKYIIPSRSKKEFRINLNTLGITDDYIFPDLEHLAKSLASTKWHNT